MPHAFRRRSASTHRSPSLVGALSVWSVQNSVRCVQNLSSRSKLCPLRSKLKRQGSHTIQNRKFSRKFRLTSKIITIKTRKLFRKLRLFGNFSESDVQSGLLHAFRRQSASTPLVGPPRGGSVCLHCLSGAFKTLCSAFKSQAQTPFQKLRGMSVWSVQNSVLCVQNLSSDPLPKPKRHAS